MTVTVPEPSLTGPDTFLIRVSEDGYYVTAEEAGTLAIWAYPRLLAWDPPISWLFPCVSSDAPGDLWGVDVNGELLVVETKRCVNPRNKRLCDPFQDFADEGFLTSSWFDSERLRERWNDLLLAERDWLAKGAQCTPTTRAPGVVPYSSHRASVARWRGMFDTAIRPVVESDAYEDAVKAGLARRCERRNPQPHFIGLLTICTPAMCGLSRDGVTHYQQLVSMVGHPHVHLRGVSVLRGNGHAVFQQTPVGLPKRRSTCVG